MSHVTVLTGPERRRRWSEEDQCRILAAAFAPGTTVAVVPPAMVELAIAGKVRLRIPPSTPPTLAAAIVKALGVS